VFAGNEGAAPSAGVDLPDYLRISREFARVLEGKEGVVSVGLGREGSTVVLIVATDPKEGALTLPKHFRGIKVVAASLGKAKHYSQEGLLWSETLVS
jgi:hypothetical protein